MRRRIAYLLRFYLTTVLIFVAAKVVFMLVYHSEQPFSVGDVFDVVCHGLSLDLSTALYFLSLPFLLTIAAVWISVPRWLFRTYYAVVAIVFALAFVADTSLYEFWGFKLDASCLSYLETPTEAMASVTTGYLLLRLFILVVVAVGVFWAYEVNRGNWPAKPANALSNDRGKRRWPAKPANALGETLFYILLIPLIVIGIRGGLHESTTNIGQVYYSQRQFLNHSAVNPVFSFLASFEKTASNHITYRFMDDAECKRIVNELYPTESVDPDTLLTTRQPNIILILLEGCGGTFTEIGGRQDVTPNLNQLAKEGVYFTRCYGNSWRTDRGTVCALSGYPSFPTMSVMKMPSKTRSLPNIAKSLKQQGYATSFLYGGDINFTNMRSYLIAGGFEKLTWMADYTKEEQQTAQWGVRDDITFETLFQMATTQSSPYLIGYSTLSSHTPWDVPIHHFDDKILNAFYYLDQCVGRFVEKFRQTKAWENTLIIMLPDHGIPHRGIDENYALLNHIPMIWIGGAVKQPRLIEQVCNQTDLPAILLGQLGIGHQEFVFSRDVLSKNYTQPFAIHTYDDGYSMYDSVSFVNYDFIGNRTVVSDGPEHNRTLLLQRGKAILQAASTDLNER